MINMRKDIVSKIAVFVLTIVALVAYSDTPVLAYCSPSPGGDLTITSSCSFQNTVDGVDNGNLTINNGATLTINAGQSIVRNSGKSITIQTGGSIALNTTGSIPQTNLWTQDVDGDGWSVLFNTQLAQDSSPGAGYTRRYLMIGSALGDGRDGTIAFAASTNISLINHLGRSCADGGDAVSYNATALSSNTATLSSTPSSGCLAAGDYVLLINLKAIPSAYPNVGNYEMLKISSVSTNTVTFTSNKTKYYGNGASDDTNLGTADTNQRVMLLRVPQYGNVTVDDGNPVIAITLYAGAWNGTKGGVLAFVASGTVTVVASDRISAGGGGFLKGNGGSANGGGKGGETYNGLGTNGANQCPGASNPTAHQGGGGGGGTRKSSCPDDVRGGGPGGIGGGGGGGGDSGGAGGGGGYGGVGKSGSINSTDGSGTTGGNGASSSTDGGAGGGGLYGSSDLSSLFLGSGGGGEGSGSSSGGSGGGNGAGIILIYANNVSVSGSISATGYNGIKNVYNSAYGGGGAGGSVKIMGGTLTLGSSLITATGGTGDVGGVYGHGGNGIIAAWGSSVTGSTNPGYTTISGP